MKNGDWRDLSLPQFINHYCRKPLSKPLRAVVNFSYRLSLPIPRMGEFASRSDIQILRHVGPQSADEIISAMKRLGWQPRLTSLEVSSLFGSAANTLTKIAASARQLARNRPEIAGELAALARKASSQADRLKEAIHELGDS